VVADVSCHEAQVCYAHNGIAAAVRALGGSLVLPEPHLPREVDLGGSTLGPQPVIEPFLTADVQPLPPVLPGGRRSRPGRAVASRRVPPVHELCAGVPGGQVRFAWRETNATTLPGPDVTRRRLIAHAVAGALAVPPMRSADLVLPIDQPGAREIRLRCVVRPGKAQGLLFDRLGLGVPERLRRREARATM
jgi:hypothetical protein